MGGGPPRAHRGGMKTPKLIRTVAATLFAFGIAGASANDPVADQISRAQAAIINALVAGAGAHAPAELARARQALESARQSKTRAYALEAENEARLAEARATRARLAANGR